MAEATQTTGDDEELGFFTRHTSGEELDEEVSKLGDKGEALGYDPSALLVGGDPSALLGMTLMNRRLSRI